MTKEELVKAKNEAIAAENYDLAQRISDEISSRKSIEELKAELVKERDAAIAKEDFESAAEIKAKLDKLHKVELIDGRIERAVEREDFARASKLKEEKKELLAEIDGWKDGGAAGSYTVDNNPVNVTPGKATLRYLTINTDLSSWTSELPADIEGVYRFNLGVEYTFPMVKDLGLVAGWGWHFNMFGYNLPITAISSQDVSSYGVNLFGSLGYQVEATRRLTFQGLLKAGPTYGYFSSSGYAIGSDFIDGIESSNIDFGGWFSVNTMLFLDDRQAYGIKAGVDIGFSGGTSFVLGFSSRGSKIKRK